jgi:hypothetical protein
MTEDEILLMRCKGPDLARVNARRGRCVGLDMTEDEIRLMLRKGPDLA